MYLPNAYYVAFLPPPPPPMTSHQPSLFPANTPENDVLVMQVKVFNIDGTLVSLTPARGFRNYIVERCNALGLRGYVWREPTINGKICALGTQTQLNGLMALLRNLVQYHFITGFEVEAYRDVLIAIPNFMVRPSPRRRVRTGMYSDGGLDDAFSTNSADLSPVLGSL